MLRPCKRAGFTSVETMIAATLLTVVLGSIAYALQRSLETFQQSQAVGELDARAARAMQRIVSELVGARASSLTPQSVAPWSSDRVQFQWPVDFAAGVPVWGPTRELGLELATGELDNGLDDDGDGLVDERRVVLLEDAGGPDERRAVLVNGVRELLAGEFDNVADDNGNGLVDEPGLAFSVEGGALVVRLTLERVLPDGSLRSVTQEAAVVLRNTWEQETP